MSLHPVLDGNENSVLFGKFCSQETERQSQIEDLKQEIEQRQCQINELDEEISNVRSNVEELQRELQVKGQEILNVRREANSQIR